MMGGPGIEVKSRFRQGSEFSFLLPMPVTHWERRLPQELPADMIGATVLAVDDHPASLKTLAAQLEDLGLTALTAKSAEEAIETLRGGADSRPISLILLDWRLPGMDGLSAARLIREDHRFRSLPIVIMSAYGAEKEMKAKEATAVTSFLPKPVRRSALIRQLMEAFGHTCETSSGEDVGASVVDLAGVRLLLAEDNKTNQIVACEMLKQAGCTVVVAENGAQAVEAVLHGTFHAVLMDVQMPEMDGLEATRSIRARPEFRILPVIAMTASAMEGDREKCLAAGMNDYVSKPFDRTELLKVLMRWIPAELINREAVQEGERVDGAVAASPRLVALPGSLEGINVREALERLGIGPQAYRNLLLGFWRDECSAAENMRRSLEQQDLSTLRRQAHSLAGASGSLSAPALGAAAKELELAAAEARIKDLPDLLIKVEQELSVVMNSISSLTEDDQGLEPLKATAGVSASVKFEDLRSLLERLDRAVRDCDPAESRAIAQKLAAIPVPKDLGEDLRQIAGLVDQYQFG
ncbi:MAG: response regulator, partial [Acidobacteriota bacterium]